MFPEKKNKPDPTRFSKPDELLLLLALQAALQAGRAILNVYAGAFDVDYKADDSPLTEADRAAHRLICDTLEIAGLPMISEEGKLPDYAERKDWQRFWMIDPLDGTKEFVSRNGEFTVNIALIENGKTILGVVYAPVIDELFFALHGLGAWKCTNGQKIPANPGKTETILALSRPLPLANAKEGFVAICSRRHGNEAARNFVRSLHPDDQNITYLVRGSSLKFCAVAEGSADVYPRFAPTMEWDSAAAQAIVELSGAVVLDAETHEPLRYNKPDLHNPFFVVMRPSADKMIRP